MTATPSIWTARKSLDEICRVPDKIISVYSLEQHVWADGNSPEAREMRMPEPQTIAEFQIDPVRPFLNDILRQMAAPYRPDRRDNPIGQGYWIQAEFGSGKSHLLCFLAALALGDASAWNAVRDKEAKAGRGKRESIYQFWEDGLEAKSTGRNKGIFVIVKTLVGAGGGAVGMGDKGQRLTDYILDAAKEQLQAETGQNISLYPAELLADRFINTRDVDLYRDALRRFLKDPQYFDVDEFEDVDAFIRDIQQNKSPEYKRSCGNKLWRFYTEYLQVRPQIAIETEEVLAHLVETIVGLGYSGVLLVLDEVSLFMKNRDDDQRADDEQTLVVLANRLAKVRNLPIWTVCAAQQAIESRLGVKNIIADDRLKLVKLLEHDQDYYDIVLARVREIVDPSAIAPYYLYYKSGFTWPSSIGEQEFAHFFPFHKPALEVLRAVTYELTTTRSAIHFMHQTLKHQIKIRGREIIRLWELFDETVRYEEDPSGVHAGLVAIKTKRESDYLAYEACKRQIDAQTKGALRVYHDRAVKTVQTLFLYHVARTRQRGLTPEEIANSVMIPKEEGAPTQESLQHYEILAVTLKKELRQIVETAGEDGQPLFRFDPVFTGVDPRAEFQKARDEAEVNASMTQEAWETLLGMDEWPVHTRTMTLDLSGGSGKSLFREIAGSLRPGERDQQVEITWRGRQTFGTVGMRDFTRVLGDALAVPPIDSDQTDRDFAIYVGTRPVTDDTIQRLVAQRSDPRIVFWTPAELTVEERDRLRDFAAYRKLVAEWGGKESEDAGAVITWMAGALQTDMGKIARIVTDAYARGRMDAYNNSRMDFHAAGELQTIVAPVVDRVLTAAYVSQDIAFEPPIVFKREDGIKVINGIVKTGEIPKGAKPNQDVSAAQNFGLGLKIVRRGPNNADKKLDTSENPYVANLWRFLDTKLADDHQTMHVETLYKNFMGIGGPKDYGLTRRMVQIYLLCLVRDARVRVTLTPRSGLSVTILDYSTIAGVDFSSRVVDALAEVQKLAKPENWDVLRPYVEKLLGESISAALNDSEIAVVRQRLRAVFSQESAKAESSAERARALFAALGVSNPYATELEQMRKLFTMDLATDNDIDALLFALKAVFGYPSYDTGQVAQTDLDDLHTRLQRYRDMQGFLNAETYLRTARAYGDAALPDLAELRGVRQLQTALNARLGDLPTYLDSDLRLRTELVGHIATDGCDGEPGTLGALIRDYTTAYIVLHDHVHDVQETARRAIQALLDSDDLRALETLERVTALRPPASAELRETLIACKAAIDLCPTPSRASVEEQLRGAPEHTCGLTFDNAAERLATAEEASQRARRLLRETLDRKLEVFLNPTIQQRLRQGISDPLVAGVLRCQEVGELRAYLVPVALATPEIVESLNRHLKQVRVKHVRFADFKPSVTTVERDQVGALVAEFKRFIEQELDSMGDDADTLPILQLD